MRRGLCVTPCYGAWFNGRILHPKYGIFRKMNSEELALSRKKKLPECAVAGCDRLGVKRALCQKHYKRWVAGIMLHPIEGVFYTKYPKRKNIIEIDFSQYPKVKAKVTKLVTKLSLPASHVVMTLLAQALSKKNKEDL